jgi:hypothetical protein
MEPTELTTLVRTAIVVYLKSLNKELDKLDQTTHGTLCFGTIEEVLTQINNTFHRPSAHTVSTLSQTIHRFLKRLEM